VNIDGEPGKVPQEELVNASDTVAPSAIPSAMTEAGHFRFQASLHGLRGLAVLYVVASHLGNVGFSLMPLPLDAIGKVGVWIFFSLSAYLLTSRLVERVRVGPVRGEVLSYAVHRIFRIYPLYILVLLAHVAAGDMTWLVMGRHMLLVAGQAELWAIPTEFQYYLFIPILVLLPRRAGIVIALVAAAGSMAYALVHPEAVTRSAIPILPKAVPFLTASAVALFAPQCRRNGLLAVVALIGLVASSVAFREVALHGSLTRWMPWVSLSISLSVAGLMVGLQGPGWLTRLFGMRWLVWIGEISFGVYLLHLFVLRVLTPLALPAFMMGWLVLGASIAVASVTYLAVERPGIRMGKAIGGRLICWSRNTQDVATP